MSLQKVKLTAVLLTLALGGEEFRQLLAFITNGLLDPKARPENLRKLVPARLPSGRSVHFFQQ